MRKLLIVSIFPLLAAGCCSDDNILRRIEVWKQQELFAPAYAPVMAAPCCPQPNCAQPACGPAPTCGAAPMAMEPTCGAPASMAGEPSLGMPGPVAIDEAPVSQTVGSPEVIDGVLEQK